jgi:4-amino-4-deoxy-L-arabinose transferase-like glycosyltransferase
LSEKRRDLLALTVGCLVLFGLRLGARDLWNPNEPIYGEAVSEMAQRGEWLIPYVNGLVFAEKPILFYWMALVAGKLLGGVSELSLRVPTLIAGIATVLGSYALVHPYAGRARALATSIVCATLFGVFWNARFVQMDIFVTATTLGVVIAITRVIDHGTPALPGFMLAGVVAAAGFIAKGPVAWICPALALVSYLAVTRRLTALVRWETAAGAATCLAAAAPWYAMLLATDHRDVLTEVLFRQNFARFVNPWDHRAPFWYYLETIWVDMAPWAFFVPLAVSLPRKSVSERRLATLSWAWIVSIVVFFSLSRSKRSPYILPIAPAIAVLAGEVAWASIVEQLSRRRRIAVVAILTAIAAIFIAGGGVLMAAAPRKLPVAATAAELLGAAMMVAGALLAFDLIRAGSRAKAPLALATGTLAVYLMAAGVTLPALDAVKSARPVCGEIERILSPEDALVSYELWNWRAEYRFYLGRPITNAFGRDKLAEFWSGSRRAVVLVEADHLDDARKVIGPVAPVVTGRVGDRTVYVFTSR